MVETAVMEAAPMDSQQPGDEQALPGPSYVRKRELSVGSGSSDVEGEQQPKRTRLTRDNLAALGSMEMPNGASQNSGDSPAETGSTTSSGFEVQATRNGILLSSNSTPPANLRGLVAHLNRSRDSPSPTRSVYRDYVDTITKAANEATASHETVSLLKTYPGDRGYARAWNQPFTAYPRHVGFNNALSTPAPSFLQGYRQLEFAFPVGDVLDTAVLYDNSQNSIALPHLAGEFKPPNSTLDHAALRAAYTGAALVHARNEALGYLRSSDPAQHASVLTVTTDGRALSVFAHHASASTPSVGGGNQYHQYRLTASHLDESFDDFRRGRRQLRNAQDYAKEQARRLRGRLLEEWTARQPRPGVAEYWSPPNGGVGGGNGVAFGAGPGTDDGVAGSSASEGGAVSSPPCPDLEEEDHEGGGEVSTVVSRDGEQEDEEGEGVVPVVPVGDGAVNGQFETYPDRGVGRE